MSDLETLMRVHARVSRERFAEDGELPFPSWLIERKDGRRLLLATPMGRGESDSVAAAVRKAIKEFGGVRYAYAVETWFLAPMSDKELAELKVRPSESPDRLEGILISGEDISGEQKSVMYEIKRFLGAKPTLGKAQHSDEFTGIFADMFAVGPYT